MIIEERSFGISAEGREAGRHAFLVTSFFGTPCKSLVMAFGRGTRENNVEVKLQSRQRRTFICEWREQADTTYA